MTKRCSRCGEIGEFYRDKSHADGYMSVCKACQRRRSTELQQGASRARFLAYQREWKRRNHDRHRAQVMAWEEAHPETMTDSRQRRAAKRARRMRAQFVERVDALLLYDRDGGLCGICGHPVDRNQFHVDHIIPLARGGEHSYSNTQVAHPRCNIAKGARVQRG